MKCSLLLFSLFICFTTHAVSLVKHIAPGKHSESAIRTCIAGEKIPCDMDSFSSETDVAINRSDEVRKSIIIRSEPVVSSRLFSNRHFRSQTANFINIEGLEFILTDGPADDSHGCTLARITRNIFHLKETKRSTWAFINGNPENTT